MDNIIKIFFALSALTMLFTSCEKDTVNPQEKIPEANEINRFVWATMHDFYLWNENIPYLTNPKYNSTTSSDSLNAFLNKFSNPSDLFEALIYRRKDVDKWSWIVDDYEALEKEFEGISRSMGYNFMLARESSSSENLIGYVRYVIKGSPADLAGLKRGDLFSHVNDQQITISNYVDLLVNTESYKLSFVTFANNTITLNGKTANMTAVEVTENPIYLDTVYTINNQKIGYLIYNSFTANYDKELNNVFVNFKNEGISKLILDLRYNGGGSVSSAVYLASMIYTTNTSKLFLKTQYNKILNDYLLQEEGESYFNMYFSSAIINEDKTQTPINSLNLQDIYIITSDNTASASEIIINGLKPYMNVVTIGTNTEGKYVASMTLKDINEDGVINPNHKWALQPIVLKIANSQGVSDFVNGFTPQVKIEERITNLSVLGDLNEPLLSTTISTLTGSSKKRAQETSSGSNLKTIHLENIHKTGMYIDNPFQKITRK